MKWRREQSQSNSIIPFDSADQIVKAAVSSIRAAVFRKVICTAEETMYLGYLMNLEEKILQQCPVASTPAPIVRDANANDKRAA
jgi:hypothetical protein